MRLLLYVVLALLAALAVAAMLFPLSLVVSLADLPIQGTVSGTVWDGRIDEARVAGREVGTVEIDGRFLPVLTGRVAGDLAVQGPPGTGTARFSARGDAIELNGIDAMLDLGPFRLLGPGGTPLTGKVDVTGSLTIANEGCRAAELTIRTDVLASMLARFGADEFELTGPATCLDGVLVADLAGAGQDGSATALIRLGPAAYVTELTLDPADARADQLLVAAGFRRTPNGLTFVTRGTYQ